MTWRERAPRPRASTATRRLNDQRVEESQTYDRDDEDADHATRQKSVGRVEGALHPKQPSS